VKRGKRIVHGDEALSIYRQIAADNPEVYASRLAFLSAELTKLHAR